ncbi:hypothetical protein [Pelagicoccus mobilis]|uniref:Replication modulator SeqA C-terminal DNA-binding domain-containing protein n=1 Tax=Pelagicoccus mobilis TaxID=415221 RepID=A0A934VK74_9BACT|nr:hypothetical protein [Pelagicoccus mobilis]MBK1876366.1 hypothetical protein [Pelagicoccus mobilis]
MSPQFELSEATLGELESRLDAEHPTIESVIEGLLATSGGQLVGDPFYAFTQSKVFRALNTDADRYLALLSKLHEMHGPDFRDFIAAQNLKRRYFGNSKEEVCSASQYNQAREIPNSKYWAIMNIDKSTKRRFLRRLLIYIGYEDAMVAHVQELISGR